MWAASAPGSPTDVSEVYKPGENGPGAFEGQFSESSDTARV